MTHTVLISGAARGIGAATARLFAAAGWRVIGVDVQPAPEESGIHRFVQADIADDEACAALFASLDIDDERLDALVNNAAVQVNKPLIKTTTAEWDAVMNVNLRSVYLAIRHAYPLLAARGGAIVNMSSVHAVATSSNIAAYATSKGALLALTRAVAIELAPVQIRVNAVLPGAIDTPMLRAGLDRGHLDAANMVEQLDMLGERTVMGRVGQPDEVAQAVLFLADATRSSFMTGQALIVDGGATAHLSTE